MKKISKLLITLTPILTSTAIPACALTSCNKKAYIVEPTIEQKQKRCEEGSYTCEFEIELIDEPDTSHQVWITTKLTDSYDSHTTISDIVQAEVDGKKVKFTIQIYHDESNNKTDIWASFNIEVEYVNMVGAGGTEWKQTINGFKITAVKDTEKHNIWCYTDLSDITIVTNKEIVNETDEFTITITNNRAIALSDANLTITTDNDQYKNIDVIGKLEPRASKSLTFTKKQIKDDYFPQGTISDLGALNFKVVRCGAYTVGFGNYIYKLDHNEQVGDPLAASEIPEKQFLIMNTYGEYQLHTESFKDFLASVENSCELTMLRGEFFNEGQGASSTITLTMNGVLDSEGNKVSSLRLYGDKEEGYFEALGCANVTFDLHNMKVQGRDGKCDGGYGYQGVQCDAINAEDCYFSGALTLWGGNCLFRNCIFDSTKTYKDGDTAGYIKNNYPMWIYKNATVTFDECTFKSIGKAIKIYPEKDLTEEATTFEVNLNKCSFELENPDPTFGPMEEYEYPLNISVENYEKNTYNVNLNECTVNDLWKEKIEALKDKIYWIKGKKGDDGYAKNVTINGQPVVPDVVG